MQVVLLNYFVSMCTDVNISEKRENKTGREREKIDKYKKERETMRRR